MNLLNEAQINEKWFPIIEEKVGIKDSYKKAWLSKYCHNHSINENFSYGKIIFPSLLQN